VSKQTVGFYTLKYLAHVIITGLQMYLLSAKQAKDYFYFYYCIVHFEDSLSIAHYILTILIIIVLTIDFKHTNTYDIIDYLQICCHTTHNFNT
jgi:hypothetical protein